MPFQNLTITEEATWDTSNKGSLYTTTDKYYLENFISSNRTLKELAIRLKRDISGVILKLSNLKQLDLHESHQYILNNINLIENISGKELQKIINTVLIFSDNLSDEKYSELTNFSPFSNSLPFNGKSCTQPTNTIKGNTMSQRRTAIVELFDDSKGLDVYQSRILSVDVITEFNDDSSIIQEVLLDNDMYDVKALLAEHNQTRLKTVDEHILKNTGNEVMLREVKLADLRWVVR